MTAPNDKHTKHFQVDASRLTSSSKPRIDFTQRSREMTSKAEELAKRLVRSWREDLSSQSLEAQLVAALREYGAEVKQRAVGVADQFTDPEYVHNIVAAIERMELP